MRLTSKLYAQHLGWMFKKHWQVQGKKVVHDTGAQAELEKLGIAVVDPNDIVNPKHPFEKVEIVGYKEKEILNDETHPNWHEKRCHVYGDGNVLLEGVPQAELLTKTIEIIGFPKNITEAIQRMQIPNTVERSVQHSILSSHVYDAEQVKLPKARTYYVLPNTYGISYPRRNRLLINKLIFECEKMSGRSISARRRIIDNVDFRVTLPRNIDILQFNVSAEKMITSSRPIEPVKSEHDVDLPILFPIKCTITIPKTNIYDSSTFYPFNEKLNCSHPHTIFSHFDKKIVGNLHGSSVTPSQFQSRTMLKAFSVAAARAKQIYGEKALGKLPKPIVIQSIQTDGRSFHFGVFQLNTLAIGDDVDDGLKNYWFHEPQLDLFTDCSYKLGKPYLEGYNKDVIRCINAFYNNS
ncbi:39S ribosomal protein L37, mitochondrial [Teleopsis dalmanni]|uniref:39S ribosomal protein L37, mitochondrial n=1 Tax=Teleopsis dalmanni TaxID=139649 RepID=UPI0018CF5E3F|nr:39S ribosomal protein L37, mitochondrial [Teleopsis dalmanni]